MPIEWLCLRKEGQRESRLLRSASREGTLIPLPHWRSLRLLLHHTPASKALKLHVIIPVSRATTHLCPSHYLRSISIPSSTPHLVFLPTGASNRPSYTSSRCSASTKTRKPPLCLPSTQASAPSSRRSLSITSTCSAARAAPRA